MAAPGKPKTWEDETGIYRDIKPGSQAISSSFVTYSPSLPPSLPPFLPPFPRCILRQLLRGREQDLGGRDRHLPRHPSPPPRPLTLPTFPPPSFPIGLLLCSRSRRIENLGGRDRHLPRHPSPPSGRFCPDMSFWWEVCKGRRRRIKNPLPVCGPHSLLD